MKHHKLLLFLLLLSLGVKAQDPQTELLTEEDVFVPDQSLEDKIGHALEHVDLTQVSSGILLDKGLPLGRPGDYVGAINLERCLSMIEFRSIFGSLYTGAVADLPFQDMPYYDAIITEKIEADPNVIPITMLMLNYDEMKPDAIDNGLFTIEGGQLYDVEGRSQSPYETKLCFMATSTQSVVYCEEGEPVSFVVDPDLLISNLGQEINMIEINTGMGDDFIEVFLGEPFEVISNDFGSYQFIYRVTLADGTVIEVCSEIFFKKKATIPTAPDLTFHISSTRGYHEWAPPTGATISVRYGCGNTKLRKPLIVVEGWEPPQLKKIDPGFQNFDFSYFIGLLPFDIRAGLYSESYDIIYVDFDNAADYIQSNAFVLQELLDWIEENKEATAEPNVIVGISMGGLVTRFALLEREHWGMNNHTRTFISLDVPHQGANFPLGAQVMIKHLNSASILGNKIRNYIPQLPLANEILDMPATKQMLIYAAHGQGSIDFQAYTLHDELMDEFESMGGFPQQTRNLSIISGSDDAIGQPNFPDNANLVHFTQTTGPFISKSTLNAIKVPAMVVFNVIGYIGVGLATTTITLSIDVNALPSPSQGMSLIYDYTVDYSTLYGTVQWNEYKRNRVANTQPYDNCPGGFMPISNFAGTGNNVGFNIDFFTFVPSVSAMNIKSPWNQNALLNIEASNVIGNNMTVFKDYDAAVQGVEQGNPDNNFHAKLYAASPFQTNGRLLLFETMGIPYTTPGLPSNSTLLSPFNYGKGTRFISSPTTLYNLTIGANGYLGINRDEIINDNNAFITEHPLPASHFITRVKGWHCSEDGALTIQNGGTVEIGSTTNDLSGTINFTDGSRLNMQPGATLIINDNSKIVFDKGSAFNFNGGNIILNGSNAIIEIHPGCSVQIATGATFTYTGSGFMRLHLPENNTSTPVYNTFFAGTGSVVLAGTHINNTVLELKGPVYKSQFGTWTTSGVDFPSTLQSVTIDHGRVTVVAEQRAYFHTLRFYAPAAINYGQLDPASVTFFGTMSAFNSKFHGYVNCFENTDIVGSEFLGSLNGSNIYDPGKKFRMINSYLHGTATNGGLSVHRSNTELRGVTVSQRQVGINITGMDVPVTCENCLFRSYNGTQMQYGVWIWGTSASYVHLEKSRVQNATIAGVMAYKSGLSMSCTEVTSNLNSASSSAIDLYVDASLTLDPSLRAGAGRNNLSGYGTTIHAPGAIDININNGRNNLRSHVAGRALFGTMASNRPTFDAEYNYWNGGTAPTEAGHYNNFSDVSGQYIGGSAHDVNGANHLLWPPNMDLACPLTGQEPGGGQGGTKTSSYTMSTPQVLAATHIPYDGSQSLKEAATEIFTPHFGNNSPASQISKQAGIITHNYREWKADAEPVISLVYQKMMHTLGEGVKQGQIEQSNASPEISTVMKVVDELLNALPQAPASYRERFRLSMDKAFTYRMARQEQQALDLMNAIAGWAEPKDLPYVQLWQCYLENDVLLKNGVIDKLEFSERVSLCTAAQMEIEMQNRATPDEQQKNENLASSGEAISVYPNPSDGIINIITEENLKVQSVKVYSIEGKELMNLQATGTQPAGTRNAVKFDLSRLHTGIYMIEISGNGTTLRKKITITK